MRQNIRADGVGFSHDAEKNLRLDGLYIFDRTSLSVNPRTGTHYTANALESDENGSDIFKTGVGVGNARQMLWRIVLRIEEKTSDLLLVVNWLGNKSRGTVKPLMPENGGQARLIELLTDATSRVASSRDGFAALIQARRDGNTDKLTNLPNRRGFDSIFPGFVARAARAQDNASWVVAILDIDHFKRVNDTYGHDFGDHVLQSVATLIKGTLRTGDISVRYGGEEFLLLFENVQAGKEHEVVDRVRQAVERVVFIRENGEEHAVRVTVSIGFTVVDKAGARAAKQNAIALFDQDLYKRSDLALYYAKEHGRNRIVKYSTDLKEVKKDPARFIPGRAPLSRQAIDDEIVALLKQGFTFVPLGENHSAVRFALRHLPKGLSVNVENIVFFPLRGVIATHYTQNGNKYIIISNHEEMENVAGVNYVTYPQIAVSITHENGALRGLSHKENMQNDTQALEAALGHFPVSLNFDYRHIQGLQADCKKQDHLKPLLKYLNSLKTVLAVYGVNLEQYVTIDDYLKGICAEASLPLEEKAILSQFNDE
jgi:diguanylate cyclase (GGDEF)-like protein